MIDDIRRTVQIAAAVAAQACCSFQRPDEPDSWRDRARHFGGPVIKPDVEADCAHPKAAARARCTLAACPIAELVEPELTRNLATTATSKAAAAIGIGSSTVMDGVAKIVGDLMAKRRIGAGGPNTGGINTG